MSWIVAILLAGGKGDRFNDTLPKQFHLLSGKKIYLYTLETFLKIPEIQEVMIVSHPEWMETIEEDLKMFPQKHVRLVSGGETRQHSSFLGLQACSAKTSHVIIHDAVRPFVTPAIIQENIALARQYGASDTCIPSHDTLVHTRNHEDICTIPLRHEYLRGQTPQSFSYPLILRAHKAALAENIFDATDDCQLVLRLPHEIKIAQGHEENIKITTPLDLILAEQLLRLKTIPFMKTSHTSLQGKVFVVTGATGGIGQEITKHLTQEGATVIPLARSSSYAVDLTSETAVKEVFKKISLDYGAIDGLINAVGYLKVDPLKELSSSEIEKMIHTNFTSVVYACKYSHIKTSGHILNLASSSYTRGRASYAVYSGMKAAIVNFTQGLALEYPHLNVNSLVPPRTDTPMRRQNFPEENPSLLLSPKIIAEEIVHILHANQLTGMTIEIKR